MKMRSSHLLFLLALFATLTFNANASPTGDFGDILKQLSSVVKWPKPSPKTAQTEGGHVLQFENGYFVETLVEGDKLGVVPHTIRVSPEGELLTVDSINNHIVRITPPLSEYSRARLVAGSSQGYSGHVDGKPIDARFKHPKGVTMDDKGNVYVADTANMAIRKIGEGGVTTIAGGKSNIAGYRDGPSEDAKFSSDFDLVFLKKTCSLLVIDRGNAALRQISLQQEDCDFPENSVLSSDLVLVVGAILAGYIFCLAQHYFSSLFSQKTKEEPEEEVENIDAIEKEPLVAKSLTGEPSAGWPTFGTVLTDLFKFSVEAIGNMLLNSVPLSLRRSKTKTDLTPLEDRLVMPEDKEETTPITQKLKIPRSLSETIQTPILQTTPITNNTIATETPPKVAKASKVPKFKDSSLSGKHRSSKRQDFAEFYGMGETGQVGSKGTKERVRHRHREKSGEVNSGQNDSKPEYSDNAKFDHYNSLRSKYGPESGYRY